MTGYLGEETEWPWPWHPDVHWYHPYLNLSSVGPEIWDALYLGVSTQLYTYNVSHVGFKWVAQVIPNFTAWDELYRKEYEGTSRNMFICLPHVAGSSPDRPLTWQQRWTCGNYTPDQISFNRRLDQFGFVYNREKPFVDICIGIGTVITTFGVPGKTYSIILQTKRLVKTISKYTFYFTFGKYNFTMDEIPT